MTGEYAAPKHRAQAPVDRIVGRVLSERYRVLRKLGEGGVGGVYLAEHLELGRTVALKILLPEFTRGQQAIQDFLNEATTAARLGHENIIDISYGAQSPDGLVFLAMEYLAGRDLGALLRKEGPLSWERARPILMQVASALAAVHRAGIVHSDIKPDNIFITARDGRDDFVKVLDFGVAKAVGATDRGPKSISGTPQYMSPEQTLGATLDARSDVYSLGCVVYQMITGTLPFQADSVIDLMAKHNYESPVPPSVRRPDLDIPPGVERIILKAMEKDPAARFQSMEELGEAVSRLRFVTGHKARSQTPEPLRIDDPRLRAAQRWRRVRVWSVFFAGLSLFLFAVFEMFRQRTPARVAVSVTPPGAQLFLDGRRVGQGPTATLALPPGRHFLWAEAPGYLRQQRELRLAEAQHTDVQFALPLSPATAIEITSEPDGLPIWLNGKPLPRAESEEQARTGYSARRLTPGKHLVEVRDGDRVWRREVDVPPDQLVRVHAELASPDRRRQERGRKPRVLRPEAPTHR